MTFLRRFQDPPSAALPADGAERDSIAANLTRLLASQREYASFLPDFGLGQTWHRPINPRTLEILRQEIVALVEHYEARLHSPDAVTLPRGPDGGLRFRLSGTLASGVLLHLVIELAPAQRSTARLESGERV